MMQMQRPPKRTDARSASQPAAAAAATSRIAFPARKKRDADLAQLYDASTASGSVDHSAELRPIRARHEPSSQPLSPSQPIAGPPAGPTQLRNAAAAAPTFAVSCQPPSFVFKPTSAFKQCSPAQSSPGADHDRVSQVNRARLAQMRKQRNDAAAEETQEASQPRSDAVKQMQNGVGRRLRCSL